MYGTITPHVLMVVCAGCAMSIAFVVLLVAISIALPKMLCTLFKKGENAIRRCTLFSRF